MLSTIATLPGCIVPVPITSQPTPADNPPIILWQDASPAFGPISHQVADMFDFTFPVDDADVDDVLVARLFRDGISTLQLDGMVAPSDSDPERRTVTFPTDAYCMALGASMGKQVYLYAVVADRPFIGSTSATAGLSDSNYWVLTCN